MLSPCICTSVEHKSSFEALSSLLNCQLQPSYFAVPVYSFVEFYQGFINLCARNVCGNYQLFTSGACGRWKRNTGYWKSVWVLVEEV